MCRASRCFPLFERRFACHHRVTRRRAAMRWYVSIGAVLVAAVIAGGVAAGIAAPNTRNQFADAQDNKASLDVELILALDVSYSMDMDELAIPREGYAQATVSDDVFPALHSLPHST